MSATASTSWDNPFFHRAHHLPANQVDQTRALFDEWASRYDEDTQSQNLEYVGPQRAAEALARVGNIHGEILDAGCGTGLAGVALAKLGATTIDGNDLSPGMLEQARKTGLYRNLETADLTQNLPLPDHSYDAVICTGVLAQGHAGPDALDEFIRVARPGGSIIVTIPQIANENSWETGGYRAKTEQLAEQRKAKIISNDLVVDCKAVGFHCTLLVMQSL